jgi:hypothetical protein
MRMQQSIRAYRFIGLAVLVATLALVGCSGDDGAPGAPGAPGTSAGTVAGTVTNSLTKVGVQGVAVSTNPSVSGGTMTTDSQGKYSGQLPIGTYTLTFTAANFNTDTENVSIVAGNTTTKNVSLTPVAPVVVSGPSPISASPGATVSVTVTASVMDGSTPTGMTWSQKSGAAVQLSASSGTTVQVTLPDVTAFKDEFFRIVDEERHALLDRDMVMGVNPLDLEEAGKVVLTATVKTSSGSYSTPVEINAPLPFVWSTGLHNVGLGLTVLLHGKSGPDYDWTLTAPSGSHLTSLEDPTTQNPYFTPDVAGKYTVKDSASGASLDVFAGRWVGVIGPDGQPSSLCTTCHNGSYAPDKFTSWKQTGHAQIFTDNLNAGGHYSPSCFPCHTVGYDTEVKNGGFDDAPYYQDFLNQFFPGGHSPTANPNNWTNMLAQYPDVARLANAQCENCHGPNDSQAHPASLDARVNISADVCGSCHGEPPRHGRFQQWQESRHADYSLALEEATVEGRGATAGSCGRCHSGQGFLAWIEQGDLTKQIQGANGNATVAELTALGLTEDSVHPQTCAVCHDPHAEGSVSGIPNNATVRISGSTPMLPAGFAAEGVGRGAICITCHNTRNGAHNDGVGLPSNYSAPHTPSQGDLLMGQNAYFVQVGQRSPHSFIADTCATCHMELSPPPAEFSYQQTGTNHTFTASLSICGNCHGAFDGGTVQDATQTGIENLVAAMSAYLMKDISAAGTIYISDYTPHTFGGKNYDVKSGPVSVPASNVTSVEPTEPHGQQGYLVNFNTPVTFTYSPSGESPHNMTLTQATVQLGDFTASDGTTKLIAASDPLVRAGWNYFLIEGDGSKGVHNPAFAVEVLEAARSALLAQQ